MKIRTLLRISLTIAILLVFGLAVTSWLVTARLAELTRAQERAQTAANGVLELLVLTHEYASYAEDRAAQQWRVKHAAIIALLEAGARDIVPVPPEALSEAKTITRLFSQLVVVSPQQAALQIRQKQLLLG